MVQRVSTVAFEGIEARSVDVQVQVAPGLPAFAIAFTINRHHGSQRVFPPSGSQPIETPSVLLSQDVHRAPAPRGQSAAAA
jgi:hypothetical protein